MLRDCILTRSHLNAVLEILGDDDKFARCREYVSIAHAEIERVQAEIIATAASRPRFLHRTMSVTVDRSNEPLPIRAGDSNSWEDSYGQQLADGRLSSMFPAAAGMEADLQSRRKYDVKAARITSVIEQCQLSIAYQPIYKLEDRRIAGLECLSRFPAAPVRAPDLWFAEAAEVGRQVELELLAIRLALQELSDLPTDIYVALNVSPDTILSGQLPAALEGMAPEQIVLEITEHTSVEDYAFLTRALQPLRQRGLRIAVDDAGAGYASLRHVLQLKPEMIKLDVTLTRNIDEDLARRALASALIAFAKETGSLIIAEGVEAASELAVLRRLGAHQAQGHVFSKPMSLAELLDLLEQELSVPREFPPKAPK